MWLTTLRILQVVAVLAFFGSVGRMLYLNGVDAGKRWQCEPRMATVVDPASPPTMLRSMQDGTCKVYVKMYGTNAVLTLTSGECLIAMGAAGKYLDSEIIGEKL
jgi:hypothetical protein